MKSYLYIAFGCFVIAAWALSVLLSGCAPTFESCWPGLDTCKHIKDKAYQEGTYTCLPKSRDYCQCLKEHGYDARVVIGKVRTFEDDHAWVEVEDGGVIYFCEPTWDWGCWKTNLWTDRKEN